MRASGVRRGLVQISRPEGQLLTEAIQGVQSGKKCADFSGDTEETRDGWDRCYTYIHSGTPLLLWEDEVFLRLAWIWLLRRYWALGL